MNCLNCNHHHAQHASPTRPRFEFPRCRLVEQKGPSRQPSPASPCSSFFCPFFPLSLSFLSLPLGTERVFRLFRLADLKQSNVALLSCGALHRQHFKIPPCLSTCPRLSRLVIFFFFLSLLVIHTLCRVENPWRLPDMAMAKVEGGVTLTNCFLHATRRIPTRLHVHDLLSHAPSLFPPRY